MDGLADLENRISSAMERIGRAVQQFEAPAGVSGADLEQALAAAANADAQAREAVERAEAAEAELAQLVQALETEATATAQLRDHVTALKATRDEQQERIAGLEAQLVATADRRKADRAELEKLIAALEPLVQEASDG